MLGYKNALLVLNDQQLKECYTQALRLRLSSEFLKQLGAELKRRNLCA
ncbi:sporulation histidine kinase inhibitor Sda [Paenibacillus larvae]|jgi:Sporulation inhibitor A|uniref:Sporulation inhibitor A n=4 Tax=Paenibacillus larvae TaxID=1464 RepID=V9W1C9_9BACL|nr:sporulation histidine kinase inhibitor Sda [Paenibacillus larvae]AHD04796.1 hypothetical protein ERIC2_c09651 [Paenibacillus larvae subsp. larvae DSM 25430]AQZ45455.1 hypothetical protein B5S25_01450 [Paenibacillus larvae subsp. pulvifaciens]ARF67360.1 hypothetical protein B7C51_05235 [Paenibacillus larvae subsp. pulvifaciens]AVF21418.1 Sporulation inhibitor A [Paenibacillus larvae subsp. larvae]AVF27424.1 Sporulation inhibitor A [Paenibacillus larvae subsp. larvae]